MLTILFGYANERSAVIQATRNDKLSGLIDGYDPDLQHSGKKKNGAMMLGQENPEF